ncbi:unnamed protein product [Oncorhynchus mykiss]|uniref:Uncharacterized protein n=1 Tax=Oncorhynchus mykiss TaxID=8022 RepID=A0A060Y4F3_ONCMY|nr:unnamed protein product [Oncorhynchus mykiss]
MAYQEGETLESWLNKATHPTNRQEDWEYISVSVTRSIRNWKVPRYLSGCWFTKSNRRKNGRRFRL